MPIKTVMVARYALWGLSSLLATGVSVAIDNWNLTTIVAGIATVGVAIAALIKSLTPIFLDSIKTIAPALYELKKQRDEIFKGSLSAQIGELKQQLAESSEHGEEIIRKLTEQKKDSDEAKKRAEDALASRDRQISALRDQLGLLTDQLVSMNENTRQLMDQIKTLKEENSQLLARLAITQEKHQEIIDHLPMADTVTKVQIEVKDIGVKNEGEHS